MRALRFLIKLPYAWVAWRGRIICPPVWIPVQTLGVGSCYLLEVRSSVGLVVVALWAIFREIVVGKPRWRKSTRSGREASLILLIWACSESVVEVHDDWSDTVLSVGFLFYKGRFPEAKRDAGGVGCARVFFTPAFPFMSVCFQS